MERTQHRGIFYKPETDSYIVNLDFGREEVFDEKTGTYKKKQIKKRKTAKTLKEAKAIKREHEEAKSEGRHIVQGKASQITLIQACEDYLRENRLIWSYSYRTRQNVHVNRLRAYVEDTGTRNKPVREYTAGDVERIYKWSLEEHEVTVPIPNTNGVLQSQTKRIEVIGYNTLNKLESFLRGLFLFCSKDFPRYGVNHIPTEAAVLPAKKKHFEPMTYTEEEVNALIRYALDFEVHSHAGGPLVMLVLGCLCGLRRGEIAGVRWSDIDQTEGLSRLHITRQRQRVQLEENGAWVEVVSTPKGGDDDGESAQDRKERYAAFPSVANKLLQIVRQEQEQYRVVHDDDYIYQDAKSLLSGVDPNSKTMSKRWKQFVTRYNRQTGSDVPLIRLHDLRHTNAHILDDREIEVHHIAYHLGHSLMGITTHRYLADNGKSGRAEICAAIDEAITTEIVRRDLYNE